MAGYVKLWREALDHEVFQDPWLWKLWCWCLLTARYETNQWKGRTLNPGQFTTGRIKASQELGVAPSTWRDGIQRLKDIGSLVVESDSSCTVITIVNWPRYQSDAPPDPTTNQTSNQTTIRQPIRQRSDTKKEGKKGRREEIDPVTHERRPADVFDPMSMVPPSLKSSTEFVAAWADWIVHRREKRKPVTPTSCKKMLNKLERLGPSRATDAVNHSVAAGWDGIFEDKGGGKDKPGLFDSLNRFGGTDDEK